MLPNIVSTKLEFEEKEFLNKTINDVLNELNLPEKQAQIIEKEIFRKYSEPYRTYHNLTHIYSLFKILKNAEIQPSDKMIFSLAIIFHDIIYTIGAKNNEIKSAFFAKEKLKGYLAEKELSFLVQMIESTVKHSPVSDYVDIPLFLDFDLSILAAPSAVYNKYAEAIRAEYCQFPDWMYQNGRRKVLKYFLGMERIYFTDYFFENYESQARQNLTSELKNLESLFS